MWNLISSFLSSVLGIGANWVNNRVNNASLTGKEREQNAFNAQQAELSRDFNAVEAQKSREFNALEAQKSRDFTAQQDNTLYQRRVADMQAAGVNPALAVGGVGSALGSPGPASSSPASSSPASGSASVLPQSMSDLVQLGLARKQAGLIDSQIDSNNADAMKKLAESGLVQQQTEGQRLANSWFVPKTQAEVANLESDLRSKGVERKLMKSGISLNDAQRALALTNEAISHVDYETRAEFNRLSMRRTIAAAALDEAKIREVDAAVNELYQRAIMESLQGGLYSASELESLERAGLIREQARGESLENQTRSYAADRKGITYWVNTGSKVASIVGQVIGGVAAGSAIGKMGSKVFGKNYVPSVSRSVSGKPFNAYYSKSSDFLTGYTQSW